MSGLTSINQVAHGLSIGSDLGDFEWPWTAWLIALIMRYFAEFDSFAGRSRHNSQWLKIDL